ncbi:uncharacterized protein LOC130612769 isoform X2 [Hydractinia symbiolongicarpus]|nr:uncharacterized protein LOC130612769 isoform X2 [Hydractinia symbiolongicarpus]XP_057290112.1 uncharacterized protein LOC130612769 isoform X2 [Hydractinia symbiolongicarpus]
MKKRNFLLLVFCWKLLVNLIHATSSSSESTPSSHIECDTWKAYGSHCYRVFKNFEYFNTAQETCQRYHGDLASVLNEEENLFLNRLIANETLYQEAWIGMKRSNVNFSWVRGDIVSYTNWMFDRPGGRGDCTEMIPGGKWSNILCYSRMQFVCQKGPTIIEDNSQLYLIMHITIPLSCVFIMFLFVGFLCIRSHKELAEVKRQTKEASPFQLVQAAMGLPLSKTPDLFRSSKGKNLWQGAIERIKLEQMHNNPLNSPETFLQRSSVSNDAEEGSNNNNKSPKTNNKFSALVQTVMRNRAETILHDGQLGAPELPSITIENNYISFDTDFHIEDDNNAHPADANSTASSSSSALLESDSSTNRLYESKMDIWLKKTHYVEPKENSMHKKRKFVKEGKQNAVDIEDSIVDGDNDADVDDVFRNPEEEVDKEVKSRRDNVNKSESTVRRGSNLVEVIVDVNHRHPLSRQSSLPTPSNIFNIYSPDKSDVFISGPKFFNDRKTELAIRKSNPAVEKQYVEERISFADALRRESFKRRDKYFPNSNIESVIERTENNRSPIRTKFKRVNNDYLKVTLC